MNEDTNNDSSTANITDVDSMVNDLNNSAQLLRDEEKNIREILDQKASEPVRDVKADEEVLGQALADEKEAKLKAATDLLTDKQ